MMAALGIQAFLAGLVLGYPPWPGLPFYALSALSLPMPAAPTSHTPTLTESVGWAPHKRGVRAEPQEDLLGGSRPPALPGGCSFITV